jgi:uncharacterized protein (TIGR02996 family)
MPVWFAYRSFDTGPTGKHVRRFDEDDTVLGWFQRNWDHLAVADRREADDRLEEAIGCDGWFLWNPFRAAAESGTPMPQSDADLMDLLRGHVQEMAADSPHAPAIFTEEDGEGGALYYLDGHFLAEPHNRDRAAYLLHEDWRPPPGHGEGGFVPGEETEAQEPAGDGPGAAYGVFLVRESKYPLDDLFPAYRVDGVRLPGLARWLLASPPDNGYFRLFPALMLAGVSMPDPMEQAFLDVVRADPADAAPWAAWADWREERGQEPPGVSLLRDAFARMARLPGEAQDRLYRDWSPQALLKEEKKGTRAAPRSLIHVEPRLAQMCPDVSRNDEPYYGQWVLFDDLWAGAHPALANALLRWCARWDVLSSGATGDDEDEG